VAPRLARFATFSNLRNATWDANTAKGAHLGFDLPSALVGRRPVHMDLLQSGPEAADGTIKLDGDLGTSTCVPGADSTVCTVKYHNLPHYGISVALGLYLSDPFHYFQRREVARQFSSDPIGIVTIKTAGTALSR
jgi:hypothetical protein